jgi:hypothetical protein
MEESSQITLRIPGDAVAEDEVVHPATHVDGIDLHEAEAGEGVADAGHRRIEQQRAAVKPAGIEC